MSISWFKCALLLQLWLQNLTQGGTSVDLIQLESERPIQHVTLIARHGARTPSGNIYPKDPLNKSEIWPDGAYQLTSDGKRDMYELGIWLRKRYDNLLGDYYVAKELRAESTQNDRTIMSSLLLLSGLFPPKGHQIWNPDLLWQPIPVEAYDEYAQGLMSPATHVTNCDRFRHEVRLMTQSEEYKELLEKYNDVIQYVLNHTGLTAEVTEFTDLMLTLDYIHSQIRANVTIPDWAQNIYPEPWSSASLPYFYIATFNDKLKRLFVGALLKDIGEQMKATKTGDSKRKMTIFLGHADNLSGLLNTLGIFNAMEPPTSSMVALELRKDLLQDNYFVAIYFKNTTTDVHWLELPGCETVCPLEKFLSMSAPYELSRSWAEECQLQVDSSATHLRGAVSLITLIIILTVCCIIL